jgi:hypothetical protein
MKLRASPILAGVAVLALASVAVATIAARREVSGGGVTRVTVVTESTGQHVGDTTWQDLPGASTSINVSGATPALILARFSGVTNCVGGGGTRCLIRILVGGVEAEPALGDNSIFDSAPTSGGDVFETHSMDRSAGPLSPGTYTISVQYKNDPGGSLMLNGWSLTVERVSPLVRSG